MAEMKPTEAQRKAMESRGSSILVSAGAGSGKTRVLTERLMKYIVEDEKDIDSFVIITFTRASAGELRTKISKMLAKASEDNPGNQHLKKQQALCSRTQIGTIHHFCSSVLRQHGHTLGIPSDFKVISEDRSEDMKSRVLEKVLNERYENMPSYPGFEELVNSAGRGRDDSQLVSIALSLHNKMLSHPFPDVWAKGIIAEMKKPVEDVSETVWGEEILSHAREKAAYWVRELDSLRAEMTVEPKVVKAYGPAIEDDSAQVRELERRLGIGWEAAAACPPVTFIKLGSVSKDLNPALTEHVKNRRKKYKADIEAIRNMLLANSAVLDAEMQRSAPSMEALLSLVLDFDAEFCREKRALGFVDYSDLEHLTAGLLIKDGEPTELAGEIAAQYTEIMVDEYQDVSRVQEAIFRAVSEEGKKLFMVGDIKQSIYSFRLADPKIFSEKLEGFKETSDAAPGEGRKILLRENFRSGNNIIQCVNAVFENCMSKKLGDIDYNDEMKLVFSSLDYAGRDDLPVPEIVLCARELDEKGKVTGDKNRTEAAYVADRIIGLISSGMTVTDGGKKRPLNYGDIAILMRASNASAPAYTAELESRGIPVAAGQSGGFFETREVTAMLSLLRAMDNPYDDVNLIAAMSSPMFGFDPDALAFIRESKKRSSFFSALIAAAEKDVRCRKFLDDFNAFRDAAPDMSADRLLRMLMDRTDIIAVCSAMPDGHQREANLMQLLQLAVNAESDGSCGLHNLVEYFDRLSEKGLAMPPVSGSESSVRIMSIHKSKGLEFPVVFLCDTDHQFNTNDLADRVLVHPELGLGPEAVDRESMVRYPTLARRAIKLRLERETKSEEMRLLYVALTRAKERLIITGMQKNPDEYLDGISEKYGHGRPAPEELREANCMLDWMTASAVADGEEHIRVVKHKFPESAETEAGSAAAESKNAVTGELLNEIERKLSFVYLYQEAVGLPSKVTATELKRLTPDPNDDAESFSIAPRAKRRFRTPDFAAAQKPATGTEKGIATHLALQYMNLNPDMPRPAVEAEIERLKTERFLSDRQAKAVDCDAIVQLLSSPLGKRIGAADKVHREFRFSLLCPAEEIFGKAEGEKILLQGVVDCCIEEDGKLVIIDYKTDNIQTEEQLAQRSREYSSQVRAYATALGRIFETEVKETVLYFLSMGRAVTV